MFAYLEAKNVYRRRLNVCVSVYVCAFSMYIFGTV